MTASGRQSRKFLIRDRHRREGFEARVSRELTRKARIERSNKTGLFARSASLFAGACGVRKLIFLLLIARLKSRPDTCVAAWRRHRGFKKEFGSFHPTFTSSANNNHGFVTIEGVAATPATVRGIRMRI